MYTVSGQINKYNFKKALKHVECVNNNNKHLKKCIQTQLRPPGALRRKTIQIVKTGVLLVTSDFKNRSVLSNFRF